jgi:hypothetical protein
MELDILEIQFTLCHTTMPPMPKYICDSYIKMKYEFIMIFCKREYAQPNLT